MTALRHQPDDPGPGHIEIHGPVRFVPQVSGREFAAIGDNPVGWIDSAHWGRTKRAKFCCTMFDGLIEFRADSLRRARVALLLRIADWHDLAGPLYAEHARLIRLQADEIA